MLLEIKNLSKEYKRSGRAFYALDNINLNVSDGQFISIKELAFRLKKVL